MQNPTLSVPIVSNGSRKNKPSVSGSPNQYNTARSPSNYSASPITPTDYAGIVFAKPPDYSITSITSKTPKNSTLPEVDYSIASVGTNQYNLASDPKAKYSNLTFTNPEYGISSKTPTDYAGIEFAKPKYNSSSSSTNENYTESRLPKFPKYNTLVFANSPVYSKGTEGSNQYNTVPGFSPKKTNSLISTDIIPNVPLIKGTKISTETPTVIATSTTNNKAEKSSIIPTSSTTSPTTPTDYAGIEFAKPEYNNFKFIKESNLPQYNGIRFANSPDYSIASKGETGYNTAPVSSTINSKTTSTSSQNTSINPQTQVKTKPSPAKTSAAKSETPTVAAKPLPAKLSPVIPIPRIIVTNTNNISLKEGVMESLSGLVPLEVNTKLSIKNQAKAFEERDRMMSNSSASTRTLIGNKGREYNPIKIPIKTTTTTTLLTPGKKNNK